MLMKTAPLLVWVLLVRHARGSLFSVTRGQYIKTPTCSLLQRQGVRTVSTCALWCEHHPQCRLGSWRAKEGGTCCLEDRLSLQKAPETVAETGAAYFAKEPQADFREFQDGWHLIFRAQGGSGGSIYGGWNANSRHNDAQRTLTDVLSGCWSLKTQASCAVPYRSQVIGNWSNSSIKQVRLGIYVTGSEVAYVVFDARGSTALSWMDKTKILSSSWTDLTSGASIYSCTVVGYPPLRRHFFLSQGYNGCSRDSGWLVVTEGTWCAWDRAHPSPRILYAPGTKLVFYNNASAADVMAVFVKY